MEDSGRLRRLPLLKVLIMLGQETDMYVQDGLSARLFQTPSTPRREGGGGGGGHLAVLSGVCRALACK